MAQTPVWYDTSDNEVVKRWEKDLDREVRFRSPKFDPDYGFLGTSNTSLFRLNETLSKGVGDRVRFQLRWQLDPSNAPRKGNETMEGRELGYQTSTYDLSIDKLRQGVKIDGEMVNQRVGFEPVEEGKDALADLWAEYQEIGASLHLCGASNVTNTRFTWNVTPNAPDAEHIMRVNDRATDQALVDGDFLDMKTIDKAIAIAKQVRPRIRPARIMGKPFYVMPVHTNVIRHMRSTSSEFFQIHLSALQGGMVEQNPIFTAALGTYGGVIFIEDQWSTPGIHSSTGAWVANTRRTPLLGANALCVAIGRGTAPGGYNINRYRWHTKSTDVDDKVSVYAQIIAAMGSPRYTRPSDGTAVDATKIVISSYAEDLVTEDFWDNVLAA